MFQGCPKGREHGMAPLSSLLCSLFWDSELEVTAPHQTMGPGCVQGFCFEAICGISQRVMCLKAHTEPPCVPCEP